MQSAFSYDQIRVLRARLAEMQGLAAEGGSFRLRTALNIVATELLRERDLVERRNEKARQDEPGGPE